MTRMVTPTITAPTPLVTFLTVSEASHLGLPLPTNVALYFLVGVLSGNLAALWTLSRRPYGVKGQASTPYRNEKKS